MHATSQVRKLTSMPLCALLCGSFGFIRQSEAAVTISSASTQNMTCSGGVCSPTAADAVLNVTDLTTMLASGNVTVNTGSGSLAQQVEDIIVAGSFNWASANSLTLDAYRSVTVDQAVAVNGAGAVALTTNDGGSGGALSFQSGGSISFLGTSNTLAINGSTYTLENSIAALAAAIASNPAGSYALASNYNASQDGTYPESPITTTLTGTVEGLGNTISNLSITHKAGKEGLLGLFESDAEGSTIESIRLTNLDVSDRNGKPDSAHATGGLVGQNTGLLFNDYTEGSVSSVGPVGGLAGVNGTGADNSGTISVSGTSASINGDNTDFVGGLVAVNYGVISECFATGRVKGKRSDIVGGLAGTNDGSGSLGEIENSYSTGKVSSSESSYVGGLLGANYSAAVSSSYSTGHVSAGGGNRALGGFVGVDGGYSIESDYWDTTTSGAKEGTGEGNVSGLTGETTRKLKSGLPSGFDPTVWAESPGINGGLPYLIANPPQ
jgi:hypothetical protein